jgi:tight adherence protein B
VLGAVAGGRAPAGAQVEVRLDVAAFETSGHPAMRLTVTAPRGFEGRALTADDFELTEDGERRPVVVSRLPNDGLQVVLVTDTSGSMEGAPIAAARSAASDFVAAMPAGTRIAAVGFASDVAVVAPLGTEAAGLLGALEGFEARGETALYDALVAAAGLFEHRLDDRVRRYMVLLSDGGDTVSTATLDDAVGALTRAGAEFRAVALATGESDLGALGSLAQATGGKVVAASDPSELAGVYDAIASHLVNQYVVRWQSASEGATEVSLAVRGEGVVARWEGTADLPALPPVDARPAPVPVEAFTAPAVPWYADERLLFGGVGAIALALAVAGWTVGSSKRRRTRRLADELGLGLAAGRSLLGGMAERAASLAERAMEDGERSSRLNTALERAGLAVRPGELVVLCASVALGLATVSLVMIGPLGALLALVATGVGAWSVVSALVRRRRRRLADQLGDTLQLLAGSMRSGHGLIQSLDMVTREAESPTAEEFHRVIVETRLGRDLADALDALAERAGNEDIGWVVQAIRIHREVGGDLAEVLDRVGETIRDRNRVRGQVRALTAEGRLSAIILMALPFLVGGWMWMTNRPYVSELFVRPAGRVILTFGAVLMAVGALILKRLVRPEF